MIEIRALHNARRDAVEAVKLQQLIWGFEDVELMPVRLFVTATKVGGQVFGAFDQQPNGRVLPGDSGYQAGRQQESICTATCSA